MSLASAPAIHVGMGFISLFSVLLWSWWKAKHIAYIKMFTG